MVNSKLLLKIAEAPAISPDAIVNDEDIPYIQGNFTKILGAPHEWAKLTTDMFELGASAVNKIYVVDAKIIHIENPKLQILGGKYECKACGNSRNEIKIYPFEKLDTKYTCPRSECEGEQILVEPVSITIIKTVIEDVEGRPYPAFASNKILIDENDLGEEYYFAIIPRAKINYRTGEGTLIYEIIAKIPKNIRAISEQDKKEMMEEYKKYKDNWLDYVVQKFYNSIHIVAREDSDIINMKLILASLYSPELIPILMVGDTGTGKTQIIQALAEITEGLCMDNNITANSLIGSATLTETYSCIKAGALVKYNNSIVCIDEMEKCNDKSVYGALLRYLSDGKVFKAAAGMTLNKSVNTKIFMNMNFLTGDLLNDAEVPLIDQIPLPKNIKTAFLRRCILALFRDVDDIGIDAEVFDAMNGRYTEKGEMGWFRKLWIYSKEKSDIKIPPHILEFSKEKALELRQLKTGSRVKVSIKSTAENIAKGIAIIHFCNIVNEEHIKEAYQLLKYLLNSHKLLDGGVDSEFTQYENTSLLGKITNSLNVPKTIQELHQELHQPKTTLQRKIKNIAIRIGTKRNNGKKPAAAYWTKKGIEYWLEDTFSPGTIFTSEDIVEKLGEVVLDEGAMNTILKQLHRDGVLDEVRDETYKLL